MASGLRSPEHILACFEARAQERNWPFNAKHLDRLAAKRPEIQQELLVRLNLDIWLGNLPVTFEEHWLWASEGRPNSRHEGLKSDAEHLRLLHSNGYGTEPSAKWVANHLGAHWSVAPAEVYDSDTLFSGTAPTEVADRDTLAGPELMVMCALHDEYPRIINYKTVPALWLSNLRATIPGFSPWAHVPILVTHPGEGIALDVLPEDGTYRGCSLPERVELAA